MKIRSAIPENGTVVSYLWTIVVADGKKAKKNRKQKKTDCKTYTHSRHLAAWMRKLTVQIVLYHSTVDGGISICISSYMNTIT